jgi:hypothetical protein
MGTGCRFVLFEDTRAIAGVRFCILTFALQLGETLKDPLARIREYTTCEAIIISQVPGLVV